MVTRGSKRVKEDLKSNTLEGNFFLGGGEGNILEN